LYETDGYGWCMEKSQFTMFLPAERASEKEIFNQVKIFSEQNLVANFLNTIQDILVVLNQERQIVYANRNLLDWLNFEQIDQVCGLRFGEAVQCVHAHDLEGGCGTSEHCQMCGAARAILSSQRGEEDIQECRILRVDGEALDLKVKATPLILEDQKFTVLTAIDISHEKRRRALERIFFHDILNTAGGLQGFSQLMMNANSSELEEVKQTINTLSQELIDEINAQRELLAAEHGELEIHLDTVNSLEVFFRVSQIYRSNPAAAGCEIRIDENSESITFITDRTLLIRVIGNMTKNALEASTAGQATTLGCYKKEKEIIFSVHNPTYVPREVQLQIFQRSFSTKGNGRGLGTYSIKLLTERYLKGVVSFSSSEEKGTTFQVILPIEPSL